MDCFKTCIQCGMAKLRLLTCALYHRLNFVLRVESAQPLSNRHVISYCPLSDSVAFLRLGTYHLVHGLHEKQRNRGFLSLWK